MIEDAQIDTANIRQAIEINNTRALQLDSLSWQCLNYKVDKFMDAEMYRHYKPGLFHPAFVSPSERTIQQLKNAGGMRLIKKKIAVDSIVLYDDAAKKLTDQQAYYELYQNKSIETGDQLFNYQRFFGFEAATPVFETSRIEIYRSNYSARMRKHWHSSAMLYKRMRGLLPFITSG